MISWTALQAFLVLTLLATESVASHSNARRAHNARHPTPGKRVAKRQSCKAKHSSFTTTGSITSTHTTTSTQAKPTTTSENKPAETPAKTSSSNSGSSNSGSSNSGSSNSGSSNSGSSSSGNSNVASVKAAAGFTPQRHQGRYLLRECHVSDQSPHRLVVRLVRTTPNPSNQGSVLGVPMLWGGGSADGTDASRLAAFEQITQAPQYMLGFEEPDCPSGGGSAGMSVADGVASWEKNIAPFKAKGTKLGSPSMCKQVAETWLKQFSQQIKTDWDFTAVHINKNNMDGVRADIEHYAGYGKPLWITEFACVDDSSGFVPCTDQGEINDFINQIVPLFEGDSRVAAYAYSNGEGLGNVWPMTNSNGALTESGQTYINAISKYHS
ncbi:Glyco-hydro-cc domain-containing protein [Mycena venus]|uniref:Glyco-hydro-cc domain-containing protein n=1 Tax=Mycena venus TaxID=2733690 RepID=A0A8H6X918_9AGAR|nr:Glyco-hydro-cc domain-containing protein [Mycena venus]